MQPEARIDPWWAAMTVWGIVNAVNVLQAAGFLARVLYGNRAINHRLGYVMIALAAPAGIALIGFGRTGVDWRQWIGPAAYIAFVAFMIVVDYAWPIEFRAPALPAILAPYLLLFFGAILLMGLPMFRMDGRLWLVTVVTTMLLLVSMGVAMRKGVA